MRNLKRALSLALASVMVLGMMVVGAGAASYPDVDSNNNLEAIEVLKLVGAMSGDNLGNFNPDGLLTRNEAAVVVARLLGMPAAGACTFTDVPSWAQPYVAIVAENGISSGIGNNQFGGSMNITAAQAALWLLRTLGYFEYQGEFGESWDLSAVKQGRLAGLFDDVNVSANATLTRDQFAQMTLNALEANVKVVTEKGGVDVDLGQNGSVVVRPEYEYKDITITSEGNKNYNGNSGVGVGTQQLCEKLYGTELKKNTTASTSDDFGRPATEWSYKTKSVKSAEAADLTYTKEVKGKDIYADLGKITPDTIKYIRNNKTETSTLTITSGDSGKVGGNGILTEVYYDDSDPDDITVTIVVIDTFLAQADEDYDVDDEDVNVTIKSTLETSATLDGDDFAVANVKEDDYLLVNLAYNDTTTNYEVKAVSAVTVVEDAVVSVARANDYVTAGGTKYTYNATAKATGSAALGQDLMADSSKYDINGDGYNLYLDAYGYVVGVEGYNAGVNLSDYLFVKAVNDNGFDGIAKVLMMDGTTKTVTVDKLINGSTETTIDSSNATAAMIPVGFYTFDTDKDGNYELTVIPTSGSAEKQGKATSATVDNVAQPISGVAKAGTSSTVFIAKDKVYTGVKNAPEVKTAGDVYYVLDKNDRLVVVYSENKGSASTSAEDLVYILSATPARAKDGDDTYYIYTAIVDGVKTTLDANQNSKPVGLYEIESYTDGRADLGTAIADDAVTNELVHYLGTVSTADYEDGTLTLDASSYLLSDDVQLLTIDGTTVKTIAASGVKKAVSDGFTKATLIETSSSNSDIITVYLSK